MKEEKIIKRYSKSFKTKVLEEISSGKFTSFAEAMRNYGIKGSSSISRWCIAYGRVYSLPEKFRNTWQEILNLCFSNDITVRISQDNSLSYYNIRHFVEVAGTEPCVFYSFSHFPNSL
ncbi:MAG: hypothetical protein ABR980_13715 [Ignavibacteriaceae bacterium]|jgi:transposase-like protein